MRVTISDLASRLSLAVLTALLFMTSSGQAYAQLRVFQMSMWTSTDDGPGPDTDIPTFYEVPNNQPDGPGIMLRAGWDYNKPISANDYNWSQVVAFLIDEPYNDFNNVGCWRPEIQAAVEERAQILATRAAELKAVAPLTRFWVNLAQPQLDWVTTGQCVREGAQPVNVNRPYIDVISVDIYYKRFSRDVKKYYDWLVTRRAKPDQQVALIPGTFYRLGVKDDQKNQAGYLQEYFDYANASNENGCNLPLGERGATGHFDGCPVWIVMGWLAQNHPEGDLVYIGERDPTSWQIANAWQTQVAIPLRGDFAHQLTPAQISSAWLPLILSK